MTSQDKPEVENQVPMDPMEIMKQKCKQFGFNFEELPEEKQEKLKDMMKGIDESDNPKAGAAKQLQKALQGR